MKVDLAIVGAGTAGAAAALFAARRGLRVACLDARPLEQAGARWVNGVPRWAFEAAGLAPPEAPELRGEGAPFHLVAGWGPDRLRLQAGGLMEVDMRLLVERLQRGAAASGAALIGGARVLSREGAALRARTADGERSIEARWFVDASGLAGGVLASALRAPPEMICAAAQEVRRCADVQAARRWFEAQGVPPGETICFTGIHGGYSILNVQLHGDEVSLLTGSIPGRGHRAGLQILRGFAAEQPWVGEVIFGGSRAIPLVPPRDNLADGPVALLGDSAGQVFSAHGSGIGAGLIAARLLADTLADGGEPWDYNVAWQRRWGGAFAGTSLFTRFTAELSTAEVVRLLSCGLVPPSISSQMLAQEEPRPPLRDLPGIARGVAREPAVVARILPVLGRMAALRLHYARYPRDPEALPRWRRRLEQLSPSAERAASTGA